MKIDIVIVNGTVVDGSGGPAVKADIGIAGDRIVAVGDVGRVEGAAVLDATGKLVLPGFIDAHGHSDVGLYVNPQCESKLAQGITTEVMGNCGYSPFPLFDNTRHRYLLDPAGVDVDWATAEEYYDVVRKRGFAMNAVPQLGHIMIRGAVLDNQDRPATRAEIEQMKDMVRDAMEAGTRGLSTGLDYACSTVADLEEIVELVSVVAEYGGFYTSHLRGYSRNVLNSVAEAIEVGRRTGVRVQLSHLGIFGRKQWGYMDRMMELIERARADGVEVACDMMPYRTKGSWWAPRAIFPAEVHDWKRPWTENLPGIRLLLQDPVKRQALKEAVEARRARPKYGFHEEFVWFSDWRDIYIEELPTDSRFRTYIGASIAEAAEKEGMEPCDLYFDLVLHEGEEFGATCIQVNEDEFHRLLAAPWTMFGTDAIATEFDRLREPWNSIQPHPRHYGSFPRVLGKFVRDENRFPLADAVRRMSGLVADHFSLTDRGYLKPDHFADVVIVDPAIVGETATWREPNSYPLGIEHVIVNGKVAFENGHSTGAMAGQMLTRTN
ncbi:N-acyl-D-amino-acid deacylase family protein [Microvirga antarctica]|uniref:N-acyl-D-amino-acid deacylase family protein n=1 Tax=Microvirga antarctica TaxID=2819233 RepID=UPI001B310C41|nr:D-aminoacylase [Microvirga antarctica]